jgi:hypothetical protein
VTDLPPIDLAWEAPAECPSLSSVRRATERLLGKSLDRLPARNVHAQGTVSRNDAGNWVLHIVLAAGDHVEDETLIAKKCHSLSDAMALKVALAIDPLAVVDSVKPEPVPDTENPAAPSDEPAPRSPSPSPSVPRSRSPSRSRMDIGVRAVAGVGLGPLPGVTPGTALYGSLQFPTFRLELGAQAAWGGVARYEALPNVGANLALFAGTLRGCAVAGSGRFLFPLCVGVDLGFLRGSGFGGQPNASTTGLWGGVSAGPALQLRIASALSLWAEVDASLTLLQPEFHTRNLGTLYSPPAAGSRAALGFELKF